MTRECSGKVLTELNPGLRLSRDGTVGSWNTIFRSSSFGNLLVPLVVRTSVLGHVPGSEWALLDPSLNIPLSNIAQPQDTLINESASYFTVNCLVGSHFNSLPVFCQSRLILLKLMHDPSHLLPHVDIPINIVFEHQSGRNFLVNNPDNAHLAKSYYQSGHLRGKTLTCLFITFICARQLPTNPGPPMSDFGI